MDTAELSEVEAKIGKATDWGLSEGPAGAILTHRHQVAIVLQHHVPVQGLLSRGQELPLLQHDIHGHIRVTVSAISITTQS